MRFDDDDVDMCAVCFTPVVSGVHVRDEAWHHDCRKAYLRSMAVQRVDHYTDVEVVILSSALGRTK